MFSGVLSFGSNGTSIKILSSSLGIIIPCFFFFGLLATLYKTVGNSTNELCFSFYVLKPSRFVVILLIYCDLYKEVLFKSLKDEWKLSKECSTFLFVEYDIPAGIISLDKG